MISFCQSFAIMILSLLGSAHSDSVIGYHLEETPSRIQARVLVRSAETIRSIDFGCITENGDQRCQPESAFDFALTPARQTFSLEEMKAAADVVLARIEKDQPGSAISFFKSWRTEEDIFFRAKISKKGAVSTEVYFSCHYHGTEMACHKKRQAEPKEPRS